MATVPGLDNLATAMAGLSSQDRYELTEQRRSVSSAFQRSQKAYDTGLSTSENDRTLALRRGAMGLQQNKLLGLSQAADTGLGWSPAVAGAALAAAAQRKAASDATAQQQFADARGALERMYQEAQGTQSEAEAALVRDAARRRDYANEIRKYGSV